MRAEPGPVLVQLYAGGSVRVAASRTLALSLVAAALVACAGSASQVRSNAADHSPASLYPLRIGYAWSYDVETEGSPPVLAVARVTRFDSGVASVATGLAAWLIAKVVGDAVDLSTPSGQIAQVSAAVLGGLALYLAAAKALGVGELKPLLSMVGGRFRRGGA